MQRYPVSAEYLRALPVGTIFSTEYTDDKYQIEAVWGIVADEESDHIGVALGQYWVPEEVGFFAQGGFKIRVEGVLTYVPEIPNPEEMDRLISGD